MAAAGERVLEVGRGPGLLAEWARRHRPDLRWIATDLLPRPGTTWPADACALPLGTGSVDLVLGLDVLHHLARPRAFFAEAARVTRAGRPPRPGRALGHSLVLSDLPLRRTRRAARSASIPGSPSPGEAKDAFDGDGALPWRIVRSTPAPNGGGLGLAPPRVLTSNGFAYLLTLGFRRGSLLPRGGAGSVLRLDAALRSLSRWTGMRALLVWDRVRG